MWRRSIAATHLQAGSSIVRWSANWRKARAAALDGAGSRRHGDLVQVGGHRRCHLRRPLGDLVPAGDGGWPGHSLNTAVGDIGCSRSRPASSRRNRDEGRCVDVAAFAEVLEEPAQLTDPVVDGAGRSGSSRPLVGMQRQPQAVVADVVPGDLGGRGAVRVDRGHVRGELSQRRGPPPARSPATSSRSARRGRRRRSLPAGERGRRPVPTRRSAAARCPRSSVPWWRSSGHPHQRLGLDRLGGPPVLVGQPVGTKVQIQLG